MWNGKQNQIIVFLYLKYISFQLSNKKKDIPHIAFKTKSSEVEGVEIFRIEDLIQRKGQLDHNPEKAHQLKFYMMVFYTHGRSKQLVDFVWHEVKKNTIIYLSKGQVNSFKFNEGLKGYMILFTESYFEERLNKLPSDTTIRLFTSHLFSPKIQMPETSNVPGYIKFFFEEFYNKEANFNKKNIINYLYNIIFSKLETLKQEQTFYLKDSHKLITFLKFKALLEENYNKSRNADFYASKLNITYKHLNVICKEVINQTAKQFIDEFIILEAKRKLINSSIKSTQLAYSMGFEESGNFVKYFKKHTGLTPNNFKKEHK